MFNPFAPFEDEEEEPDPFGSLGDLRMRRAMSAGFQPPRSFASKGGGVASGPVFAAGRGVSPAGGPKGGGPSPASSGSGPKIVAGPSAAMTGPAPRPAGNAPAGAGRLGGGVAAGASAGSSAMGFAPLHRDKTLLDIFEEGQRQSKGGGSGRPAFDRRVKSAFSDSQKRLPQDEERRRSKGGGGGRGRQGGKVVAPKRSEQVAKIAVGQSHSPHHQLPKMSAALRAAGLSNGAQAAVVKLISTGGGRASAAAMLSYNSRDAAEAVELEDGSLVATAEDQKRLLDEWEKNFEKREPSRDVTTLTVSFDRKLDATERAEFQTALSNELADQRMVVGFAEDSAGNTELLAVMSVASREKGRIKTTDHARDKTAAAVFKQLGEAWQEGRSTTRFAFSEQAHGIYGLQMQLRQAAERAGELSGLKDKSVTTDNAGDVARNWRKDLRSYGGRDIAHITISSKAGTYERAFVNSVRDFLASEFGNHKYAFALHGPKDQGVDKKTGQSKATQHVHIHAMVLMRGVDGKRLDPNIQDFQRWREVMAFHAQEHGINMVATRRTENVNAPPFKKGEQAQVAAGRASLTTVEKVQAKRTNAPVYPKRIEGQANAIAGRQAFREVIAASGGRNAPVELAAARMAARFDQAFAEVNVQKAAAQRLGDSTGVLLAFEKLVDMIKSQPVENMTMAERQAQQAALDRVAATSAAVSESLDRNAGEQRRFDNGMKVIMERSEPRRGSDQAEGRAIRSRAVEAQAEENARAAEIRAAREAGAGNALEAGRAQELARQQHSIASGARGQAELAENAMRNQGASPRVQEAAQQVVRTDTIRPDVAAQQAPTTPPASPGNEPDNNRNRGRKR